MLISHGMKPEILSLELELVTNGRGTGPSFPPGPSFGIAERGRWSFGIVLEAVGSPSIFAHLGGSDEGQWRVKDVLCGVG